MRELIGDTKTKRKRNGSTLTVVHSASTSSSSFIFELWGPLMEPDRARQHRYIFGRAVHSVITSASFAFFWRRGISMGLGLALSGG